MDDYTEADFSELVGKTLTGIQGKVGDDELFFITDTNEVYGMYHRQDCCESVYLEDIAGDPNDLVGSPIVQAYESTSSDNPEDVAPPDYQDSFTWTFYNISTARGSVTLRWYGESNGYYSEEVDFVKLPDATPMLTKTQTGGEKPVKIIEGKRKFSLFDE